jgi:hypothetical protein
LRLFSRNTPVLKDAAPLIENRRERLAPRVLPAGVPHRVERIGFAKPDQGIPNQPRPFLEAAKRVRLLRGTGYNIGTQDCQAGCIKSRALALEGVNRVFGCEFVVFRAFHPRVEAPDDGPAGHVAGQSQVVAGGEIERSIRHGHVFRLSQDARF